MKAMRRYSVLVCLAVCLATSFLPCPDALAGPYKISTNKQAYVAGEPIVVQFSGAPGYWRDWICIVPRGAPDDEPGEYYYSGSGAFHGSISFEGKPAGDYEARAYFDYMRLGYVVSARCPFKVLPPGTPLGDGTHQKPLQADPGHDAYLPKGNAFLNFLKTIYIQFSDSKTAPGFLGPQAMNYQLSMKDYHLGEVLGLEADRFGAHIGHKGLWNPLHFLSAEGLGIFFLEPYRPQKTPVLFIHGAGGYPREWKYLIDRLDRNKYQAWVFQYGSGMRLDWSAQALSTGLKSLRTKYNFNRLSIVAHSVGGLVAKKFLVTYTGDYVKLLVTIATPWGGHNAARVGVSNGVGIIPCWYDMVPTSPFLSSLHERPARRQPPYFLFFGYKGKYNIFIDGNGDGTVSLESMLHPKAQREAFKVYGFNADHTSILTEPRVAEALNKIMATY